VASSTTALDSIRIASETARSKAAGVVIVGCCGEALVLRQAILTAEFSSGRAGARSKTFGLVKPVTVRLREGGSRADNRAEVIERLS
jgi:hypothetical protein